MRREFGFKKEYDTKKFGFKISLVFKRVWF